MSDSTNVNDLLGEAADDGVLGEDSMQAFNVADLGEQIQDGLGVSVDDVDASEVVLVSSLVDDSGSIRFAGNTQTVRDGVNLLRASLLESKQGADVLMLTRLLSGGIINPYTALEQSLELDQQNYNPSYGTPLYDETVVICATAVAKAQEFSGNGVPCRSVTVLISDGADMHSRKQTEATCRSVITDMLRTEQHIVMALGIPDPDAPTDFRQVFGSMGIPDEWILTPGNSASEIRRAFQVASQSAVSASQSAVGFSQAAKSGFGGGFGS